MDIFKILNYGICIPCFLKQLFNLCPRNNKFLLMTPKVKLEVSIQNFVFIATKVWDKPGMDLGAPSLMGGAHPKKGARYVCTIFPLPQKKRTLSTRNFSTTPTTKSALVYNNEVYRSFIP